MIKDDDVDNCPRCNEDMRMGDTLCRRCREQDAIDNDDGAELDHQPPDHMVWPDLWK